MTKVLARITTSIDTPPATTGEDAAWLAEVTSKVGAVVGGRWTYEAARHWGDKNPRGLPFFIVTHRPDDEPEGGEFTFLPGVEAAVQRTVEAAAGKDVHAVLLRRRRRSWWRNRSRRERLARRDALDDPQL